MNKSSIENAIELNQIVKEILYQNSKIELKLMKKYTNEMFCLIKNLEKLGFLDWKYDSNLDTIEYEFKWPQFLHKDFKTNIFYLFPKVYDFHFDRETNGEEYISIFIEGISSYEDYLNNL